VDSEVQKPRMGRPSGKKQFATPESQRRHETLLIKTGAALQRRRSLQLLGEYQERFQHAVVIAKDRHHTESSCKEPLLACTEQQGAFFNFYCRECAATVVVSDMEALATVRS